MLDLIKRLLTPPSIVNSYWQKKRLRRFIESCSGVVLNIGSKNRYLGKEIIYLDIQPDSCLDVVCDIHALPFKDNKIGGIVATAILEHVSSPDKAVSECYRVLCPRGQMYASIPFIYGYHADPYDFQRYTHMGIQRLFKDFEILELIKTRGIGSTLAIVLKEFFSILFCFNNKTIYKGLRHLFGWVLFPLKYIDFLTVGHRFEYVIASSFTVIAKKDNRNKERTE